MVVWVFWVIGAETELADLVVGGWPRATVMRCNIVNRLSVWHYCKNNCLHVFQWFGLTLLLRKCGEAKVSIVCN